jgi:hypothetical protein
VPILYFLAQRRRWARPKLRQPQAPLEPQIPLSPDELALEAFPAEVAGRTEELHGPQGPLQPQIPRSPDEMAVEAVLPGLADLAEVSEVCLYAQGSPRSS